jgi:hypothetical protein
MVGTPCGITSRTTHIINIAHRARYIEVVHQDEALSYMSVQPTPLITYTSGTGNLIHTLPKHVQSLVGNIPTLDMPMGWYTTCPKDLIVVTDGSVLLGSRYHSRVIATSYQEILLTGDRLYDGDALLVTSYCSKLSGLTAGLEVVGTLLRSGLINICFIKYVCDNN